MCHPFFGILSLLCLVLLGRKTHPLRLFCSNIGIREQRDLLILGNAGTELALFGA
jgi:hypothetical protein